MSSAESTTNYKFHIRFCLAALGLFLFLALFFLPQIARSEENFVNAELVLKLAAGKKTEVVSEAAGVVSARPVFPFSSNKDLKRIYKITFFGSKKDLEQLRFSQDFEYVQDDFKLYTQTISTNDPTFTLDRSDTEKQWWISKIRVPEAWELGRGSSEVTVAVIDTGINALHEDLNDGRVGGGYLSFCQVVNPATGTCALHTESTVMAGVNSDDNGHGTIVAGIIGAIPNNNKGIAGINWKVRLMPVKVLDNSGTGSTSDVSAGIVWAVDNGADIINMSLGGTSLEGNAVLKQAIEYAYNAGVLVVAAAGNDSALVGADLDINPVYPVCMDGGKNMVLGVGASDIKDQKAGFSNFGRDCVDLLAPGTAFFNSRDDQKGILSTYFDPAQPTKNNLYVFASGTSMAAPMVSGVAALLKSAHPDLEGKALRDRLIASVKNIDGLNPVQCLGQSCTGRLGSGRLDAFTALQARDLATADFIRDSSGRVYKVESGMKRPISDFVFQQRNFDASRIKQAALSELESLPLGQPVPPLDGSLVKARNDSTIYLVDDGVLLPVTFLAFRSHGFNFSDVVELPDAEILGYRQGPHFLPANGAVFKLAQEPAVYFMHEGKKRLISLTAFLSRGFVFSDIVEVDQQEFARYPDDAITKLQPPLDGTLVKTNEEATVYVFEDGRLRMLSARAFSERGYQFSQVKVITPSELSGYLLGEPIL